MAEPTAGIGGDITGLDQMLARAEIDEAFATGAGIARAADLEASHGAASEAAQPGGAPGTRTISPDAVALIIAFEVTSRAAYERLHRAPVWPGGASGVTIGIGYDLGHLGVERFKEDWGAALGNEAIRRLSEACGATGEPARALVAGLRDLCVEWEDAEHVFRTRTLPLYTGLVERALPNTAMLSADALGALVSLVYNRGASFRRDGDRFAEMRAILSHMARRTPWNIPAEIRAMRRIWAGQPGMAGLLRRREAEAALFERGLETAVSESAPAAAGIHAEGALGDAARTVGGWLSRVVEAPARDMIFAPVEAPAGWPASGQEINPGEAYVALRVLSARVVHARRLFSRYHAAVHARLDMLYEGGSGRSEREVVLAPDDFRNLDPSSGGRLLQLDRPLFGPAPYLGDLRLSLGLFSVKSSDLAGPYLALLSQLAETSALGLLRAAQPYVAPLRAAVELLFGTSGNAELECGVVRGFGTLRTGLCASIGATRAEISPSGLHLDPFDLRLLRADGSAVVEQPYVVFSIERTDARADWIAIPDLREAWEALRAKVTEGAPEAELRALLDAFRRRCLTSPDLTPADGHRLVRRAEARFNGVGTAGPASEAVPRLSRFSDLDLYGARG